MRPCSTPKNNSMEQFNGDDTIAEPSIDVQEHEDITSISELLLSLQELKQQMGALREENIQLKLHLQHFQRKNDEEPNCKAQLEDQPDPLSNIHGVKMGDQHNKEIIADLNNQKHRLENLVTNRDETITEFEEKVRNLIFHNRQILEVLECSETEIETAERTIKELLKKYTNAKEDNYRLTTELKATLNCLTAEMINVKKIKEEMHEQERQQEQMKTLISVKTTHSIHLLEKIQNYEKTESKMNYQLAATKRENDLLKALIRKLGPRESECLTIEEKKLFQRIADGSEEKQNSRSELEPFDLHDDYMLQLRLNDITSSRSLKSSRHKERKKIDNRDSWKEDSVDDAGTTYKWISVQNAFPKLTMFDENDAPHPNVQFSKVQGQNVGDVGGDQPASFKNFS